MKGGIGSRVVGGAYLQLLDGMVSQYITILPNMNVKHLNSRWFYIRQVETYVQCDVDQIPASNMRWSERPISNGMEQVRELQTLLNHKRLDGVVVMSNFIFW